MKSIWDFIPARVEVGVGLVLSQKGRYIFFLAGERHHCPGGELFYAGLGGHLEKGETLLEAAQREAWEEIGVRIKVISAEQTYHLPQTAEPRLMECWDFPRPLALYEMIHPPGTPRAGQLYHIVVLLACLLDYPAELKRDEVGAVIALTEEQLITNLNKKLTLQELLAGGAKLIAGGEDLNRTTVLYPLGTARALALILSLILDSP